jgi:hypothetical protein
MQGCERCKCLSRSLWGMATIRYKMGHLIPSGGVVQETVGSGTFDAAILRHLCRATLPQA